MRERIGAALRGCPPDRLIDARAGARPYKLAPVSDAPGARALHAVGLALASGRPVLCFLGPASTASGNFHEALNAAVLTGAAVVFLVTHRHFGEDAPIARQLATTPAALGGAYGISVTTIHPEVDSIRRAVRQARAASKPAIIQVELES